MLCLHGKPAVTSTTDKGTFLFCGEPFSCNFVCPVEHASLYEEAIQKFLATKQTRPVCCAIGTTEERRHAKTRVVRDASKASFGRPFFVCSKEKDKCHYFEWGDEIIIPKPLCSHGKPCTIHVVKKEGPNKGRSFLCCAEPVQESCKFFLWVKTTNPKEVDEDPLEPGCYCLFTNPTSYQYTVKNTRVKFTSIETDRKKAYAEFLRCNEKPIPTTPDDETTESPTTSFSKTFRMPPACKRGNCGHFKCCFDQEAKRKKSTTQGPPSSKCPDLSFTIDPATCFGKALEPYSEDGRISGKKFREIESQHKRCTYDACRATTEQE